MKVTHSNIEGKLNQEIHLEDTANLDANPNNANLDDTARFERTINRVVDEHSDMVFRLAFTYMKSFHDADDIVQSVFLKFLTKAPNFESADHEKAWIIRVTANACKDALRIKAKCQPAEEIAEKIENEKLRNGCPIIGTSNLGISSLGTSSSTIDSASKNSFGDITSIVFQLPPSYREVVFLYYYEGYSTSEIAELLDSTDDAVRTRLSRARKKIRSALESALKEGSDYE